MGCIHSLEMNENKIKPKPTVDSLNTGSPKSPMNEDPRSPGYNTPNINESNKDTNINNNNISTSEFAKPNLRIRIPSENKSKVIKYTRNKYIDEDDESYCLFCKF